MTSVPSIKELRKLCQKTAPNPDRESKFGLFSRIFSIYFTKLFLYTPATPNQITAISTLVFFMGICMFFFGTLTYNLIGVFLIFFSIVLDGCDGEVARYRKKGGIAGTMYVEPVSHDFQYGFGFLLLAGALFYTGVEAYVLVLGAVAGISKLVYRLLEKRFWELRHADITDEEIEALKKQYTKKPWYLRTFHWTNKNIFSSTGVCLMLLIFVVIGNVTYYLWLFALGYGLLLCALFAKHVYVLHTGTVRTVAKPNQSE